MPQVDGQQVVPELGRHVREIVTVVARRVVDEHANRPVRGITGQNLIVDAGLAQTSAIA